MSNELVPFSYNDKQVRVIRDEAGNPWWVAKDVCDVLEISNVPDSMSRLDDDEKLMSVLPIAGQNREVWTINEPGLYALIMRSNKPEAKSFKRWVTHEVLPTIRKTGTYTAPNKTNGKKIEGITVPDKISAALIKREYKALCDLGKIIGLDANQSKISANKAMRRIYGTDCLGTMEAQWLIAENQQREYCPRDLGLMLTDRIGYQLSAQKINKYLLDLGYQERNAKGDWVPTDAGKQYAVLKDTEKAHHSGTPIMQLFWKQDVLDAIYDMAIKNSTK